MIYASPSLRWPDAFRRDLISGRNDCKLGTDFLHAALASDEVAGSHIFADDRGLPDGALGLQRYLDARRIEWQHMALLPRLAEQHDYVWVTPSITFGAACALRRGLGHVAFPVCGVVRSPVESDILGGLALAILRAEPCDVLVTTNRSALRAIQNAIERAADWLKHECSQTTTRWPEVKHVPQPIDVDAFRPREKPSCREILSLPKDKTIVLCCGQTLRGNADDHSCPN
jgi:hypothetical protein